MLEIENFIENRFISINTAMSDVDIYDLVMSIIRKHGFSEEHLVQAADTRSCQYFDANDGKNYCTISFYSDKQDCQVVYNNKESRYRFG